MWEDIVSLTLSHFIILIVFRPFIGLLCSLKKFTLDFAYDETNMVDVVMLNLLSYDTPHKTLNCF